MILSNRKLKLIIISLLLLIFCWFVGLISPKAATYTGTINYRDSQNNWVYDRVSGSRYSRRALNSSGNTYYPFKNYGEGTLIFSFTYTTPQTNTAPLSYVGVSSDYEFICDIGTTITYSDSQTQAVIVTASCPCNMTGSGLKYINIGRIASDNYIDIRFSEYATFVTRDNTSVSVDVHQQDVVNAITSSQSAMVTQIQNASSQAHQDANAIKDTITNDSIDTSSTSINSSSWNNKNATNSTITSLLTLPISLLSNIVNGLQTSCTSFSLGSLFGTNLTMPCINLSSLLGTTLFNVLDILISGFMIYNIAKKLIKIFNDFTNLNSNQIDELYGGGK